MHSAFFIPATGDPGLSPWGLQKSIGNGCCSCWYAATAAGGGGDGGGGGGLRDVAQGRAGMRSCFNMFFSK